MNSSPDVDVYFRITRSFIEAATSGRLQKAVTALDIDAALEKLRIVYENLDSEIISRVRRRLEAHIPITEEDVDVVIDDSGHVEWDEEIRKIESQSETSFWWRYRNYIYERKMFPEIVVERLSSSTRKILSLLENPKRLGDWDVRGMVIGQVQSGKTASYIGLACRAADAGYPLIIVLAGTDNNLRSQTQLRFDSDFLGYNTKMIWDSDGNALRSAIGVGLETEIKPPSAYALTSSANNGDFGAQRANQVNAPLGVMNSGPTIAIVKKNATVLKNLRGWLQQFNDIDDAVIKSFPVLIIDDEADSAGMNVNDPEIDPTKINQEIRLLLKCFSRRAYVAYTATPFANIFARSDEDNDKYGPDLFPSRFIISLKPPSNYFGPAKLFGLGGYDSPMPLYREVKDDGLWISPRHDASFTVGEIPVSLQEAIYSFILICAARNLRGQHSEHSSMLVHATRFNKVQSQIRRQVDDEVDSLRAAINFGNEEVIGALRDLWERDFMSTSRLIGMDESDQVNFSAIRPLLQEAVADIEVRSINGEAKDVLDYFERKATGKKLKVIAIGGNKLSRGLTLEGLVVSYYLRSAGAYDTLLQMGRWFGYREEYEDLCRLYTSRSLWERYRQVSIASQELFDDVEEMSAQGLRPKDFILKVRNSVTGMTVTARNRMRSAEKMTLGFAGSVAVTTTMYATQREGQNNIEAVSDLIGALGELVDDGTTSFEERPGHFLWHKVPTSAITERFFEKFETVPGATKANSKLIADYIKRQALEDELTNWTVVIASPANQTDTRNFGGLEIRLVERSLAMRTEELGDSDRSAAQEILLSKGLYTVKTILNPSDESLDFSLEDLNQLKSRHDLTSGEILKGSQLRAARPRDRGLLILYAIKSPFTLSQLDHGAMNRKLILDDAVIGFAISFPPSSSILGREYVVPARYLDLLKQEIGMFSDDESDLE
jgi:hypothetical protein